MSSSLIKMSQHPDALYDAPYEDVFLDLSKYKTLNADFSVTASDDSGVLMNSSCGAMCSIQACGEGVVRIRISPDASVVQPSVTESLDLLRQGQGQESKLEESDDRIEFTTKDFNVKFDRSLQDLRVETSGSQQVLQTSERGIRFSQEFAEFGGHKFFAEFALGNENIFGFGGRITHPNRTGTTCDVFAVKAGVTSGDYGGFPVPFFYSTDGYGIFLNNPWPHVYFDMGHTNKDKWFVHSPGGQLDIFIIKGPEFSEILQRFTALTARPPAIPKSMLGFWVSSLRFVTAGQALDVAKRLREEEYPCDVFVLDGPWRGGPNFMEAYRQGHEYPSNDMDWHEDFGDGVAMMAELKDMGIKTSLHLNSRNFDKVRNKSRIEDGLLRQHDEEVVVNVGSPDAEKWYASLLGKRIREGVDVWWTDHTDRVSGTLFNGLSSRNLFGTLWNRLLSETMQSHGHQKSLSLTRGSGIGGQEYGLPWPGDTRVGIDAFEEDIWFCLNAGLAGYPITSVDMGGFALSKDPHTGYKCEEEKVEEVMNDENICRRLCQSIFFIPAPRIHNNWDGIPKLPWNCSAKASRLYREMLRIRYQLTPYIYSYALHAANTGEPILRPLVYHNRMDENTYSIGNQFYMGESMIVAPVTHAEQESRKVYLPDGQWYDMWSGKKYQGSGHVKVDAPLYEARGLPVFIKAGAIIPQQKFTQFLSEEIPQKLQLHIYPAVTGELQLHESPDVSNLFCYEYDGVQIKLHLENNSEIDRTYEVILHSETNASYSKTFTLPSNSLEDINLTIENSMNFNIVE